MERYIIVYYDPDENNFKTEISFATYLAEQLQDLREKGCEIVGVLVYVKEKP